MKTRSLFVLSTLAFFLQACSYFGLNSGTNSSANESTNNGISTKKQIKEIKAVKDDSLPRKRLMILPFLDSSDTRPQVLRDRARAQFIKELNQQGDLIVVDTADLKLDLSKQIRNGDYLLPEVAKAAHDLGVNAILEGKIVDLKVSRKADPVGIFRQIKTKFEAVVRVRVATARSGKEIFNTTKSVILEESQTRVSENITIEKMLVTHPDLLEKLVADAFVDFAPQITGALTKIVWEGRIAMINGDRIFLNVGKMTGIQPGDLLKVTEEGAEVFDPQTGNFIGKTPGRMKGTLEIISFFGQDGSIAIIHSGAGFKESDRVEQY